MARVTCLLLFLALFFNGKVDGVSFDLVRTPGAHIGSNFFLGLGSTEQYRFLLFDLTETNFWTFATLDSDLVALSEGSGPFDLSSSASAKNNVTNATYQISTTYKLYNKYGYYDAPMDEYLKAIKVDYISTNNGTLRNLTQICVLPVDDMWRYRLYNGLMMDGVFGIGNGLMGNTETNWTMGWMNKNSTITINTPIDLAATGKLIINETTIPDACEQTGVAVNMSKRVYLRYGDFEFNITDVFASYDDADYYYYYKTWPATVSTMSSFITVDNNTWSYLVQKLNPVFDAYGAWGNDIPPPYYRVHCSDAEKIQLKISLTQINGDSVDFVIPGTSLIKPNPNGECFLRVKQNDVDAWVLGTPFLENYCIQIAPQISQITFTNLTDSMAYPPTPAADPYVDQQSQLFYSLISGRG